MNLDHSSETLLCVLNLQIVIKMQLLFLGVPLIVMWAFDLNLVMSVDMEDVLMEMEPFGFEQEVNGTVDKTVNDFRLPTSVIPLNYRLQVIHILEPSNSTWTQFSSPGMVWITVNVIQETGNFTMHMDDMVIHSVNVTNNNEKNDIVKVKNTTIEKDLSVLVINFEKTVPPGEYIIFVKFTARIADDRLNGLYLDYYFDPGSNRKHLMATTLFAPNHARKAIPCFDEPRLRASFEISIGHPKNFNALSNMPALKRSKKLSNRRDFNESLSLPEGYIWTTFDKTPKMSTYIVAMITSDLPFDSSTFQKPSKTNMKVPVRIYAPRSLLDTNSTQYAMDMSVEALPKMISYFDEDYPLPKLEIVSLPHFFFSAMENWGLLTFKDPAILSVPNVTTENERARVAEVLGHELSHQYFGNLVGLHWWSCVWLKEGFSTFYADMITDWIHPELHPRTHFTTTSFQVALRFDESGDSHPLNNPPKSPGAVGDIYTRIPYKKGASILRMTEAFMTPEVFYEGVKNFVRDNKYGSAGEDNLLSALGGAEEHYHSNHNIGKSWLDSSVTVKDILNSWIYKPGFPLVTVEKVGKGMIRISQTPFQNPDVLQITKASAENDTVTVEEQPATSSNSSWWIPVTMLPKISYNVSHEDYTDIWIPENQSEIFLDYDHSTFILNPQAKGYYRVLYNDSELFSKIVDQLEKNFTHFPAVARSQLLDDYFSLASAGYADIGDFLNITRYLNRENQLVTWTSALGIFSFIEDKIRSTCYFPEYQKYVASKLIPAWTASRRSLKDLQDITEKTRLHSLLFKHVCLDYGLEECSKILPENITAATIILPDEQETTFCSMMITASENEAKEEALSEMWTWFEEHYHSETFSVLKSRYLNALACTRNATLLTNLLNWTVNTTLEMHDVDKVQLVNFVANNPNGIGLILPFLQNNFHSLYKNASVANPVIEGIKALTPYYYSDEHVAQLGQFVEEFGGSLGPKKKSLEKEIRKVRLNGLWINRVASSLQSWVYHENNTPRKGRC